VRDYVNLLKPTNVYPHNDVRSCGRSGAVKRLPNGVNLGMSGGANSESGVVNMAAKIDDEGKRQILTRSVAMAHCVIGGSRRVSRQRTTRGWGAINPGAMSGKTS